jgi:hypothetical protein
MNVTGRVWTLVLHFMCMYSSSTTFYLNVDTVLIRRQRYMCPI